MQGIMKKNILDNRVAFIVFHQAFLVAMVVSIYAYDYIILRNPSKNEIAYLITSIVCLLVAILSFIAFAKTENIIAKKQRQLRVLDLIYF